MAKRKKVVKKKVVKKRVAKKKSRKVRVRVPKMGVFKDLKDKAKGLIKKHGSAVVDKVAGGLSKLGDFALNEGEAIVGSQIKSKLPRFLHGRVDKTLGSAKSFVSKKGGELLRKGTAGVKNRIAKVQ